MAYKELIKSRPTPQSAPLPGREAEMAENLAGGYAFNGDPAKLFEKWLMLGTPNNLYYESGQKNVMEHLALAREYMAQADASKVAAQILTASYKAVKVHTPILALAVFSTVAREDYHRAFPVLLRDVLRTGSHLLEFVGYVRELRGFGPKVRHAVGSWFTWRDPKSLAYQVLKYQNRYGWTMRDVLRMVKLSGKKNPGIDPTLGWIVGKVGERSLPDLLALYDELKKTVVSEALLCNAIEQFNLTWEMIPGNQTLTPAVWRALFSQMPVEATIRNLGNLTDKGLFQIGQSQDVEQLEARLTVENLCRAHIHPLNLAMQAKMYDLGGEGGKSKLRWGPNPKVTSLLMRRAGDMMANVEPSGKRILHAIDVSGSMFGASPVNGLHPSELAGIMALTSLKSDPKNASAMYFHTAMMDSPMAEDHTIRDVLDPQSGLWRGVAPNGTDASLPFKYAAGKRLALDAVVIYTDGQSWAGERHVSEAFLKYQALSPKARAIFVYVVAYGDRVTLSDPKNPAMHDVVASADLPKVIQLILGGEQA